MGCDNCKKKEDLKKQMYESTKVVENWVVWFFVIWSGLAIYGLYTLVSKIL